MKFMFSRLALSASAAIVGGALLLTGCGSGGADEGEGRLHVVAAFYPLAYVAEQVGGDHAEVANLTPPGTEAHHLELTPQDVAALTEADLVLYLEGFQPAVDEALAQASETTAMDVGKHANLRPLVAPPPVSGDAAPSDHTEGGSATDPHFWLDPLRYGAVVDAISSRLADLDPEHADAYRNDAARLNRELRRLHDEFSAALDSCRHTDLVTSHSAFGYLAERYGFTEIPVAGVSPDSEPAPGRQADVAELVRERGITTIYYDTLSSPDVARALAADGGAEVAALDPLEGIGERSAGNDYLSVMRANLEVLRKGQGCT